MMSTDRVLTLGLIEAVLVAMMVMAALPAFAAPPGQMEEIVVTATRTEKLLKFSPWSVSVLSQVQIQQQNVDLLADVLRDMPGVSVSDAGQAGQKRIRIRGEEARRVALLIDGEEFIDHHEVGVPLLVDVGNIQRVELIRGPASVLYGGKAMGGVINVITTTDHSAPLEARLTGGWNQATRGTMTAASLGGRSGGTDWQLDMSSDVQHDRDTPDGRIENTGYNSHAAAISVRQSLGHHELGLRYEKFDASAQVYVSPAVRFTPPFLDFSLEVPVRNRDKVRFDYQYQQSIGALQSVKLDAYRQTSDRVFNTRTVMELAPGLVMDKTINTNGDLVTRGVNLQSNWAPGEAHAMVAGVQYLNDRVVQRRLIDVLMNGAASPQQESRDIASLGTGAVYIEDDWRLSPDLSLVGGARAYRVSGRLEQSDQVKGEQAFSDRHAIASLSAVYSATPELTLRADVSQGYIYPSLFNLSIGAFAGAQFVNPVATLKPETSVTRELGARFAGDRLSADLTIFHTTAHDYIDHVNCLATDPCLTSRDQIYKNIGRATTFGIELWSEIDMDSFLLYADLTWLRRRNVNEGLDTFNSGVPALNGRLGIRRQFATSFSAEVFSRFQAAADETKLGRGGPVTAHYAGFGTLNATLQWSWQSRYEATLSLENISDKRYSYATEDLVAPGRHVRAMFTINL